MWVECNKFSFFSLWKQFLGTRGSEKRVRKVISPSLPLYLCVHIQHWGPFPEGLSFQQYTKNIIILEVSKLQLKGNITLTYSDYKNQKPKLSSLNERGIYRKDRKVCEIRGTVEQPTVGKESQRATLESQTQRLSFFLPATLVMTSTQLLWMSIPRPHHEAQERASGGSHLGKHNSFPESFTDGPGHWCHSMVMTNRHQHASELNIRVRIRNAGLLGLWAAQEENAAPRISFTYSPFLLIKDERNYLETSCPVLSADSWSSFGKLQFVTGRTFFSSR